MSIRAFGVYIGKKVDGFTENIIHCMSESKIRFKLVFTMKWAYHDFTIIVGNVFFYMRRGRRNCHFLPFFLLALALKGCLFLLARSTLRRGLLRPTSIGSRSPRIMLSLPFLMLSLRAILRRVRKMPVDVILIVAQKPRRRPLLSRFRDPGLVLLNPVAETLRNVANLVDRQRPLLQIPELILRLQDRDDIEVREKYIDYDIYYFHSTLIISRLCSSSALH